MALRDRAVRRVVDVGDDDGTAAELLRRHGLEVASAADWDAAPSPGARAVTGGSPATALVGVRGGITSPPPPTWRGVEAVGKQPSLVCEWALAPHEEAVRTAFGLDALPAVPAAPTSWPDVVRFDTVDHLWAAALGRVDVARRLPEMSPGSLAAARDRLAALLTAYLTADATLRIPAVMAVR